MKQSKMACLASLIAGVCVACSLSPNPSSLASSPPGKTRALPSNCGATDFAGNVQLGDPNYTGPTSLTPPNSVGSLTSNMPMYADIVSAFNAAPPIFRTKLCLLDGVFIDQRSCGASTSCAILDSWGFRDPNSHARYVGLSASLWTSGQAQNYSNYETMLFAQTLLQLTPTPWPGGPAPTFSSATPSNATGITILATLAHEYGHILWYDELKQSQTQENYNPNQFCNFFANSWQGNIATPPQYLNFGKMNSSDKHNNLGSQIDDLKNAINEVNPSLGASKAASIVNHLYSDDSGNNQYNGVWPSLLGAISPEEDFVETFKVAMVSGYNLADNGGNTGVTSMPLVIFAGGSQVFPSPNIYADLNTPGHKRELKRKIVCVINAVPQ